MFRRLCIVTAMLIAIGAVAVVVLNYLPVDDTGATVVDRLFEHASDRAAASGNAFDQAFRGFERSERQSRITTIAASILTIIVAVTIAGLVIRYAKRRGQLGALAFVAGITLLAAGFGLYRLAELHQNSVPSRAQHLIWLRDRDGTVFSDYLFSTRDIAIASAVCTASGALFTAAAIYPVIRRFAAASDRQSTSEDERSAPDG